jgi:flavodoxin
MARAILIAYFTWSGNTRAVAQLIHQEVGGTLFEIQPEVSYPTSYSVVLKQAKKEIQEGYRPVLRFKLESCQPYEVIFVGSPNWWGTIAPPVTAFLAECDLSGKTLVPFITHGGGGEGRTIEDIKKLCPQAKILEGLAIYKSEAKHAQTRISAWLRRIGIIKKS